MRLLHYSKKPITELRSVSQDDQSQRGFKPRGLWVSVEGKHDWREWVKPRTLLI